MMDKALLNIYLLQGKFARNNDSRNGVNLGCHGSRISQFEEHRLL